jgi:hypothetical protein
MPIEDDSPIIDDIVMAAEGTDKYLAKDDKVIARGNTALQLNGD